MIIDGLGPFSIEEVPNNFTMFTNKISQPGHIARVLTERDLIVLLGSSHNFHTLGEYRGSGNLVFEGCLRRGLANNGLGTSQAYHEQDIYPSFYEMTITSAYVPALNLAPCPLVTLTPFSRFSLHKGRGKVNRSWL